MVALDFTLKRNTYLFGLMFCCHHLEIFIISGQVSTHFDFALGSANYVASSIKKYLIIDYLKLKDIGF